MVHYEYKVSVHSAESFREMVYFCSQEGSCSAEVIPSDQIKQMELLLNESAQSGWELVQATFGKQGVLIFWKRPLQPA